MFICIFMILFHGVSLYEYWLSNTITIVISFSMVSLAIILMFDECRIIAQFTTAKFRSKMGLLLLLPS